MGFFPADVRRRLANRRCRRKLVRKRYVGESILANLLSARTSLHLIGVAIYSRSSYRPISFGFFERTPTGWWPAWQISRISRNLRGLSGGPLDALPPKLIRCPRSRPGSVVSRLFLGCFASVVFHRATFTAVRHLQSADTLQQLHGDISGTRGSSRQTRRQRQGQHCRRYPRLRQHNVEAMEYAKVDQTPIKAPTATRARWMRWL